MCVCVCVCVRARVCVHVMLCTALCRNIVSTVNLGCKLDLKTIALRARNAEYNPKVPGRGRAVCVCVPPQRLLILYVCPLCSVLQL